LNETLISNISQLHERQAKVVFARDTRASGPSLVTALKAALDAVHVEYTDYGLMTTPQLHYVVRCINTMNTPYAFGEPTEKGYYEKMATAFKTLMHGRTIQGPLTVDCANGVGGPKLRELLKYLPTANEGGIDIKIVNDDVVKPEALNFEVCVRLSTLNSSTDHPSAVQTMSRPNSALHPTPTPSQEIAAVRLTVTPIVWSTTTPMSSRPSTCWMVIVLPPLAPYF
jgi:hypothetical protein